ncbi:MAG: dTDP-glucose 4,6-dehydratase [Actinomycetota bacterium]
MKIFVTGGAGFIGSNYVRWVLSNTDHEVVNYDALTYAGNLSTMRDVDDSPRYSFVRGNICNPGDVESAMRGCDAVVHFAAESHVDRSIEGPDAFVRTNCDGTNFGTGVFRPAGNVRGDDKKALVTNLSGSRKVMQVSLSLMTMYDDRVFKNVEKHRAALRSGLLDVLRQVTEAELAKPDFRNDLALRLRDRINAELERLENFGGIDEVFFTEFVVQ